MECSLSKPIFQFEAQQNYRRHLSKLQSIVNSRKTGFTVGAGNALENHQRLRHRSIDYHLRQSSLSISRENEKMLDRLMKISNRKKSSTLIPQVPKIVHYLNPARKIRERLITEVNHRFAQRLIRRQSVFNAKIIRREIEDYQKLKQTLTNNKKALKTSLVFTDTLKSPPRRQQYTPQLKDTMGFMGSASKSVNLH